MAVKCKLYLLMLLILAGCLNQNNQTIRIEQVYQFNSFTRYVYNNVKESTENTINGELRFSKDSIVLLVYDNVPPTTEKCLIKNVAFGDDSNQIKFNTDRGKFVIDLINDSISNVTYLDGQSLTEFEKSKSIENSKLLIPKPLEDPELDWRRIEIKDVGSIDLPPIMEIQAGEYREQNQKHAKEEHIKSKIEFNYPNLILQQKGLNEHDLESLKKYARVMFNTKFITAGEAQKLDQLIEISNNEILELDKELKSQIANSFKGTEGKLIQWHPVEIVEINNMPAIKISYKRQMRLDPYVIVEVYKFQNYDRIHELTLSYREAEEKYWHPTLFKVLKSFRISNVIK